MKVDEDGLKQLSPLTLAFLGDGVYELLARKAVVLRGNMPPKKLNAGKVELVRASAQAVVYDRLEPLLTTEERDILRRGRNAHAQSARKSADSAEYHKATAVEALFGYLYLKGEQQRMRELFAVSLQQGRGEEAQGEFR